MARIKSVTGISWTPTFFNSSIPNETILVASITDSASCNVGMVAIVSPSSGDNPHSPSSVILPVSAPQLNPP